MASLNWQESSEKTSSRTHAGSATPQGMLGFIFGVMGGAALSMSLVGVVLGYAIGARSGVPLAIGNAPQQVAQQPTPTQPQAPLPPATPPTVDDDAVLGDKNAKVTVVEFTDYQCPFCGRHFTNTYGQLKKDYIDTGKIKYVVRDFPLSFHPHAQKTAEATECADDQKKFWEMHDKIFETQAAWSNSTDIVPTLKQYAADLKLNTSTFNTCLDSGKYKDEVQKDMADGTASGVNGTPGFWVLGPNGKTQQISGAVPLANFQQAIDPMLQ